MSAAAEQTQTSDTLGDRSVVFIGSTVCMRADTFNPQSFVWRVILAAIARETHLNCCAPNVSLALREEKGESC